VKNILRQFDLDLTKIFASVKASDDWLEREFDPDGSKSRKIVVYSLLLAFFGIAAWTLTSYQTQAPTSQSRTSVTEASSSRETGVTTHHHHYHDHSTVQTVPSDK
jgi:hypothetical protein